MVRNNYKLIILLAIAVVLPAGFLSASSKDKEITLETNFIYNDKGKRDPFWTLLGGRGVIINYDKDILVSDMVVEGVMAEPTGESVAIINGNIVKLGDKIGLFVVKDIKPTAVILEKGQEIFTLKLKKED
jgi:hypothetical protein